MQVEVQRTTIREAVAAEADTWHPANLNLKLGKLTESQLEQQDKRGSVTVEVEVSHRLPICYLLLEAPVD